MAIELAELVGRLREELSTAMEQGKDADLRFEVGPVEIEATVAATREGTADTKVKFWVVEVGAGGKVNRADTQKIKLTLVPRTVGRPDTAPWIAGGAVEGED